SNTVLIRPALHMLESGSMPIPGRASHGRKRASKLLDADSLFDFALKALGARALSTGELRQKLLKRAESPASVDAVLTRLKEDGYLNDSRFAESYAASRRDNKGFGKMRVLRDLRQRRVAPPLAERAVSEAYENVDEKELIEQFLARKYRSVELGKYLHEPKNLASAFRRLRYAGFSGGASITVLKRYASRADELDDLSEAEDEE
ncbi:MAG: regulatory protein RecX, partial [Bryobacteraceae bacterium]